ncbi:MAG: Transcriptional regulator, XRE family [Candidatus Magasanikbacteria bacterium GW2011_GWC2_37_14]|uniref:Transcriptional regulator, XRE family n=1 Tax=Candidatus Magasanikbacteria bacterium GW2011_GWC2_37_14 TaxID=1619046 RepID=A0A0G0JHD4_9BACT|nr:MAG: Transcriptional regulator, XRE family [Candidatus Magasanikbacteria bacterium GW2011_GWC2_37_14]
MNAFFCKKLNTPPKRVCLRLKELREEKKITLIELANKTKIDKKYLEALEKCQFEKLPKALVYQKNIVRRYVETLGLKPDSFLEQYLIEETHKQKIKHPHTALKNNYWNHLPTFLRYGFLAIIILAIVFYLGWQVKNIIKPPKLIIYSPIEGYITENDQLLLVGETEREAKVTVNGKDIKNNENGQFKETINLSAGINTITITTQKKHGKTTTQVRHIVYRPIVINTQNNN